MFKLTSVLAVAAAMSFAAPALADDLKSAPADAFAVVRVDVKAITGSALFKDLVTPFQNTPDYKKGMEELQAKAGFDPFKDLSSVTIFLSPGKKGDPAPVIIAEGTFKADKIIELAKKEKLAEITDGGAKFLYNAQEDMGVAITNTRVVMANKKYMAKAVKGTGGQAKLAGLAGKVNQGDAVWFAVNLPAEMKKQMGNNPMANDLQSLRGSLSLAGGGLGLAMAVGTATAKTAGTLAQMGQAQLAEAAKNPGLAQMGFADAINKASIKANGTDVAINVALSEAELGKAKAMIGMMMMAGAAAGAKAAPEAAPAQK